MATTPVPHFPPAPPIGAVRDAVEQERLRIAHDLHDDLGGRLIAAKLALAPLLDTTAQGDTAQRAAALLADAQLDHALAAMQRVLHDLQPPELAQGLVAALQQMADDYRLHALPCDFESDQAEIDAAPEVVLGLLRICREALTNVSKHALATRVSLRLRQLHGADACGWLLLDVVDDGRGYPADAPLPASIQRRTLTLGGTLERHSAGVGCHLLIRVPMSVPA